MIYYRLYRPNSFSKIKATCDTLGQQQPLLPLAPLAETETVDLHT